MQQFKKPNKIRSKKIRDSARGEACTLRLEGCVFKTGVVFAHINSKWKGMGNKSPDLFGCYACHKCHRVLDAGGVMVEDQLRALQETQIKLYEKGLIKIP